jgi:putative ABC transport system permease protein
MAGKTSVKNILREIQGSMGRFTAIFAIVTLGVGFLSGLLATTPDLKISMDRYFKQSNMMDIFIKSTMGLTESDAQAIKNLSEVDLLSPAFVTDAMVRTSNDETLVTRIYGLPLERMDEDGFVNRMQLVEGRFPQNENECVVQTGGGYLSPIEIGTVLTITENPNFENLEDAYNVTEFTVTGIVISPLYITKYREPSGIGNGRLGMIMFVKESCYALDVYTDFYITLADRSSLLSFTAEYEKLSDNALKKIEGMAPSRTKARQEELYAHAYSLLDRAEKDYLEGKETARREFADARRELDRGRADLIEGERLLVQGRITLEENRVDAARQLQENEQLLRNGEEELASARRLLAESKVQIDGNSARIERYRARTNNSAMIRRGIEQYDAGVAAYNEGMAAVLENEQKIAQGWEDLRSGRMQAEEEFEKAEREIEKRQQEIIQGFIDLEKGEEEYALQLADTEKKLEEGLSELEKAKLDIVDLEIPLPVWYVLDRNSNVGCMFFKGNAEKIDDVAKVFPLFFILIAALVVLSTMTRMVEEERIQIGTLKALGFQKRVILNKYLIYCALTGVLGSIAGTLTGFQGFPIIIYNAFGTLYNLPPLVMSFNWSFALIACGFVLTCTMGATIYSCYTCLWEKPASLLIPRPPKSGRRIFLEYMPFIWNRMKFSHKVTARNLIRHKKHLVMTITGIAGCTALMITGFGLRDSVYEIAKTQFEEIFNYDLQLELEEEIPSSPFMDLLQKSTVIHSESGVIIKDGERLNLNIIVPKNPGELSSFINFRDRRTKKTLPFSDNEVILTEMIARKFNLKPGDTFILENANGIQSSFKLSGITENYVGVTVYLSPLSYIAGFSDKLSYNTVLAFTDIHDSAAQDSFTSSILAQDNVLAVEFTSQIQSSFNDFLDSINSVVMVIIFSSGALAMIVLYNLTNININERKKEIATLRVLGFQKKEAAAYIFREIAFLSAAGIIVGLFLGIPLHRFVVGVAENPDLMFGRRIVPLSFILSGILTVIFSAGVDLFMLKKLGSINMAESMKME